MWVQLNRFTDVRGTLTNLVLKLAVPLAIENYLGWSPIRTSSSSLLAVAISINVTFDPESSIEIVIKLFFFRGEMLHTTVCRLIAPSLAKFIVEK
jgi:hypothetical protein